MALAEPVKTAQGLRFDAFVLRLQEVATGALAWGNPVTSGRAEVRIEALESKVDQLLAQSGAIIPTNGDTAEVTSSTSAQAKDVIDQGLLTIDAANMLLNEFRTTLMPHCPFVIISPQMTAETLRRDKPFLLLTILTAALHDNMPLQRRLEKQVKKVISDCMIFDGTVSFEILQGLLVHLAWCQYHSRPRRFSQYLHLAISIITDLQLDRPPENRFWRTRVNFDTGLDRKSVSWGREEKRAVIGYSYLSSSQVSPYLQTTDTWILQKGCSFPYSPYFESMCKLLATDAEYPSDRYLLHIVQLQQISEKITLVSMQHVPKIQNSSFGLEHYYRELKSEIDLYRANLPFLLTESQILFMQFYTVEMYLCQITLFDHKPGAQALRHESSFQIEVLRMGLTAAKTLLHYYMCLPLGCDAKFPNVGWVQLGFAVTLACKLVVAASEPSVHPHTVDLCRALDISNTMRQCILRIQALITSDMDASGDRDVFFHYEKRLKRVQWWFESQAIPEPNNDYSHHDAPLAEGIDPPAGDPGNCVDTLQSALNGPDNYIHWPGFFPDTAIDEMYIDWIAHSTTSFDQQHLG
ncbi:hypothetical protein N7519_004761 [Penicillium mononematosum]|uniref:uncharacterized protein n=1 Tax=Penicillium mononematosum TaxID=268346 RepID=UPI0025473084|nr:uncharacterized protein N7519_004761 [Penicillium mononematosum]KAJ6189853.1 hypothetical protein N7519_004761 [Penicillium mononematosum]